MRKFILAFVVASVLALCSFGIVGCGGSGGGGGSTEQADFVGVWDIEGMTDVSEDDMALVQAMGGVQAYVGEDGTFSLDMMGMIMVGTYEFADGQITVTIEGEGLPATIDGGKLTFAQDGTEMTFTKTSDECASAPTESSLDTDALFGEAA